MVGQICNSAAARHLQYLVAILSILGFTMGPPLARHIPSTRGVVVSLSKVRQLAYLFVCEG